MAKKRRNTQSDEAKLTPQEKMANTFAEMLIERIGQMEEDWKKPWISENISGMPRNWDGRMYNGVNAMMLLFAEMKEGYRMPVYMTFMKALELGAEVRKGQHGYPVSYWSFYAYKDGERITAKQYYELDEAEREGYRTIPFMRLHTVFNVDQTTLAEVKPELYQKMKESLGGTAKLNDTEGMFRSPELDYMLQNGTWVCPINVRQSDQAYFSPGKDEIVLPLKAQFNSGEEFYGTMLHEMAHSTGSEERLGREMGGGFGSQQYGREELVAEMVSALTAHRMGFGKTIEENNVAYLKAWLKTIKENPSFIMTVMEDVNKAADMIEKHVFTEKMAEDIKQQAIESIDNFLAEKKEEEMQRKNIPTLNKEEIKNMTGTISMKDERETISDGVLNAVQSVKEKGAEIVTLVRYKDDYMLVGEDTARTQKVLRLPIRQGVDGRGNQVDYMKFHRQSLDIILPQLVRGGFRCAIADEKLAPKQQVEQAEEKEPVLKHGYLGNGVTYWRDGEDEYSAHITPDRKVEFHKPYTPAQVEQVEKMAREGNMFADAEHSTLVLEPVGPSRRYTYNDVTGEVWPLSEETVAGSKVVCSGRTVLSHKDYESYPEMHIPSEFLLTMTGYDNIREGLVKGEGWFFNNSLYDMQTFMELFEQLPQQKTQEELDRYKLVFYVKDGKIQAFRQDRQDFVDELKWLPHYRMKGNTLERKFPKEVTEDMPVSAKVTAGKCVVKLQNSDDFANQKRQLLEMGVLFSNRKRVSETIDRMTTDYNDDIRRGRAAKDKAYYVYIKNGVAVGGDTLLHEDRLKVPFYHFGPDGQLKNCRPVANPNIKDYEITFTLYNRPQVEKVVGLSPNDAKARLLEHYPGASKMQAVELERTEQIINPKNNETMAKKSKNEENQVNGQAAEQQVNNEPQQQKTHKDGIEVYKVKDGPWVVQAWKDGVGTPARRIGDADLQAYFDATKGKTKEVVNEERQKLYDKYLSPEAEAKRAAQQNTFKLEKPAEEVAARLGNISMFDGKNGGKMLRASIDGADPIYKEVKPEQLAAYFEGSKNKENPISKEEWADRRVALAAVVFSDKLAQPKVEEEQSTGMKR